LLSMDSPDEDRAAKLFSDAQASARLIKSRSFELRAATSLAALLQRQGKDDEAVGVLAPIYDWFEEGFATADLTRASALLTALREVTPTDRR
jgi:predicted ATPase